MAVVALRSVRDQTMVLWTDPQRQGWNSQQPVRLSQNRDGRTIILCIKHFWTSPQVRWMIQHRPQEARMRIRLFQGGKEASDIWIDCCCCCCCCCCWCCWAGRWVISESIWWIHCSEKMISSQFPSSSDCGHWSVGGRGGSHGWETRTLLQIPGELSPSGFYFCHTQENVIWSHMEARCSNSDIDFNLVNPYDHWKALGNEC